MTVYMRDAETGRTCKRGQRGTWYLDFTIKGTRYRQAIPEATNKHQALRAEAQARSSVFDGTYGKRAGQASFVEFAQSDYLKWARVDKRSFRFDEVYVPVVCDFFKGKRFCDITPKMIEQYRDLRLATPTFNNKPRNPNSVVRELAMLSKIFTIAIKKGYCEKNPCQKVDKPRQENRRLRVVTDAEESKILTNLSANNEQLRIVFIMAVDAGLRRGEIFGLEWSDLRLESGVINIRKEITKNKKNGVAIMTERMKEALQRWHDRDNNEKTGLLFTFTRGTASFQFANLCKSLEIENVTLHTLRHTYASRLMEAGVHPFVAQYLMRHAKMDQTSYYSHAAPEMLREAIKTLENRSISLRAVSRNAEDENLEQQSPALQ